MPLVPQKKITRPVTLAGSLSLASILAATVLLSSLPQARGAEVQGVKIHEFSSEYLATPDLRHARNLVGDSGLYGDHHTSSPRGALWLSSPTTAGAYSNAFVTFDLGSEQSVHQMKVWNYNETGVQTRRGVQTAHISWAGEDLVFTTNLLDYTFDRAPGAFTNNFAQLIDLDVEARYIRINVVTNFGSDNRVGLSKVRFINTNTPPTIKLVTKNISGNRVMVQFSEPVLPLGATNPANYSIQSGVVTASVSSVALNEFNDRVFLQTSTLDSNLVYTLTAQNIREATDSISITNTTIAIEPELVLWLRADEGVTADGSGFVTQWEDQSGVGNDAISEPDPTSQPTLVNDVLNGKPVLRFDGFNDGLLSPHSPSLVAEGDISFFAVVTPQSFVAYNGILSKCGDIATNYPAPFDFELNINNGRPRLLRGNGSVATTLLGTAAPEVGLPHIVEIIVRGTNATHYLNGNFNGEAAFRDGVEDRGNPVRIGRREDNNLYMNGDIAEIILLRGAVTEGERLEIDAYLGRKYGIITPNTGAPIITSEPTNVTSYVGQSATFSVGFTNGALPRTYQWFKTPDTLLSGQTEATLTINNLTLADDGSSYFLIASNVDDSVQSEVATLTVLPLTAPYFSQQPEAQTIYIHQPATFSVSALGPDLSYQWNFNNTAIDSATNTALTVENVSSANAGNYTVTVSNSFGTTNSEIATLTVLVPETGTYPAAVLTANPLVYYRFNDITVDATNTLNLGSLGSSHDGTYEGSFVGVPGPQPPLPFEDANLAYNDETLTAGGVRIPAFNMNTNAGARATFAAWVYKDFLEAAHAAVIFTRATGQTCGLGVDLLNGENRLEYHWSDLYSGYDSGLAVPNSQWTFIALVVEPTQATLYVNAGSGMQSATNVAAHTARPVFNPGYVGWDPFNANRRWFGSIDEPMIFDRALSPAEIEGLYSGTEVAPPVQLGIVKSGEDIILNWSRGTLQQADEVDGTYLDVTGAASPHTVTPSGSGKFYRVEVQP